MEQPSSERVTAPVPREPNAEPLTRSRVFGDLQGGVVFKVVEQRSTFRSRSTTRNDGALHYNDSDEDGDEAGGFVSLVLAGETIQCSA